MTPAVVVKRDGRRVPFDQGRIAEAIRGALGGVGQDGPGLAEELARVVGEHLARCGDGPEVGLEDIQDACVLVLQESGHYEAATAFIRWRDARERARRERIAGGDRRQAPNLAIVDGQLRRRPWDPAWLAGLLAERYGLPAKAAEDAVAETERLLAGTIVEELPLPHLLSLVDAALVRLGMHGLLAERAPLRLDQAEVRRAFAGEDGRAALEGLGRAAALQHSLAGGLPPAALRHWCRGRLWIDGLDDPRRGARLTATVDGAPNPWQVLASAFAIAGEQQRRWRRLRLVLPPSVLGHLERGAQVLVPAIAALARMAEVHLYCDGRTPLLDEWPFAGRSVGLATWNQDFLLEQRLQELGQRLISGPHLLEPGHRHRVVAEAALNAQGLDGEHGLMDDLAHATAAAMAARRQRLEDLDGELRFAVYGLPHDSSSRRYLEEAVVQEGRRLHLAMVRVGGLSQEACAHLGRFLDDG